MSETRKSELSEERKKVFKKDIKEGIEGLKKLFIAAIAIVLKVADALPKSKPQTSITKYKGDNDKTEANSSISTFKDKSRNSDQEPLEVAVEVESKSYINFREVIVNTFLYPILAAISTTSLVIGINKIDPVIKWAITQNECVQNTNIINKEGSSAIAQKVMMCNGGHEN